MRKKSIGEPINGNIVKKQLTHRQTLMNICEIEWRLKVSLAWLFSTSYSSSTTVHELVFTAKNLVNVKCFSCSNLGIVTIAKKTHCIENSGRQSKGIRRFSFL